MRNYFDMSQIQGDKIRVIVEEALEGRFDTFDDTMKKMGGPVGMVASDFVTKNARNALVCMAELKKAFTECEIKWSHHHHGPDIDELIRKFKELIERMFTQFFHIVSNWKTEIYDGFTDADRKIVADTEVKFQALKEENEARKNEIERLGNEFEKKIQLLQEENFVLEKRVKALEDKVNELENVKVELTNLLNDKLMNLDFEIRLLRQQNM